LGYLRPVGGEGLGADMPGSVRITLMTASGVVAWGVGWLWPTWAHLPLAVWLALMTAIYGVSVWLWSREVDS
jgi:hypothetical protein